MEWQLLIKVIIIIFGIALLWGGSVYGKKDHEQFSEGVSSVTYSGSFIAHLVVLLFGFLLSIGPWWLAKIFVLLFAVALLYFGIFLL